MVKASTSIAVDLGAIPGWLGRNKNFKMAFTAFLLHVEQEEIMWRSLK